MERLDERGGGGMSGDERSQRRGARTDRYGNEVKRETEIRTFPSLPLCIYPSKKERVRPNKTFIIPGKLFNVFDIKRLKEEERDEKRREGERERGGCIYLVEWMVVKGGEVAGLGEAEDKKSEAEVGKEASERGVQELKGVNYTVGEDEKQL